MQVLHEIRQRGQSGRTADEIENALRLRHQTATPRCWELKGLGLIVMTSTKRRNRSGRMGRVYVAAGVPLAAGAYVVHSRSPVPKVPKAARPSRATIALAIAGFRALSNVHHTAFTPAMYDVCLWLDKGAL
jgi:hypothetical protein